MRYKSFFLPDYKIGMRLMKPEQTGMEKRKKENQNKADCAMEKPKAKENVDNWSEKAEDLAAAGDTDGAISLIETQVLKLQELSSSDPAILLQLASAHGDLASLYSSKGFSLKADDLRSRASLFQHQASSLDVEVVKNQKQDTISGADVASQGHPEESTRSLHGEKPGNASSDDDWEAIADCAPDELLSSLCLPGVSELSLKDTERQIPKRRGRGTFSYENHELYSDQLSDKSVVNDSEYEDVSDNFKGSPDKSNSSYSTRHVLVLTDFPLSTRTTDLEKLFEDFKDRGFDIRWVNDTTALAVFRSPSIAIEASNRIQCPFTVRILNDDDTLLSSIPKRDLEPPRQRPQTSTTTARRLIAQGMGIKLPPTTSGSQEYRDLEEARKNRIASKQKLRNDAWGDD